MKKSARGRNGSIGYLPYVLPLALGFLFVVAVPFGANVFLSLFRWKGGAAPLRWAGLDNYVDLLGDELFWSSFRNSALMIVAVVIVPTAIGIIMAAVLFDYLGRVYGSRVAGVLRATYYLPQVLPIAIAGVIWSWVLDARTGAINEILRSFGVGEVPDWLGDPRLAIYSIMLILVWLHIGYPVVIFMSALQRVDPELYEAAAVDGAGWWRRFFAITLPQIRPETFIVVLTTTISALKVFAPIYVITAGGPESSTYVPSYYSYRNFFELSRVGYGSALATVLAMIILALALTLLWWQRRSDPEGD